VRGTPIAADGRVFVPEARVTTFAARQASFLSSGTRLAGLHATSVRPTALIERTAAGERRYPIHDATGRILLRMALAALVIPIAANWIAGLANSARKRNRR
jgi:hypothetical protein